VMTRLRDRFAVHALERRGRGGSGDSRTDYRIEQEFDDVVTAVHAIGEAVDVVAHSFGAICAMEAALRTDRIRALVLYEPPISPTPQPPPPVVPEMEARLARGDRGGVLEAFMVEYVGIPAAAMAQLKAAPYQYRLEPDRLARLNRPVCLLTGSESHALLKHAAGLLREAIPGAKQVVLAGQHHVAMDSAPELFIREVLAALYPDSADRSVTSSK
jgi:pimeloyl-ACP methyl ester carboxylesterase